MRRGGVIATLAVGVSLGVAPSAMSVTIGSNLTSMPTDNQPDCGFAGLPCTAVTFDAPPSLLASGGLRSPINGVVTSWTFKSGSTPAGPSVSLRVLRPTTGLSFTGVGTSAPQAAAAATNGPFLTQLPINAGDAIGLNSSSAALVVSDTPGATMASWQPNLLDGQTRMGTSATSHEVMVQATVEPTSTIQAAPKQTLKAKKKQKLAKAAVTDTLDKSGTVSVQARVKVPSGSQSSRTLQILARAVKSKTSSATLAANVKTKIKLKFSANARRKIKAAIKSAGPRKVVVTATAKDTFGNVSKNKVRFKLIG
jgi:hypothetical protein